MRTSWILIAAMVSFSALAQVSDAEKAQRVQFVQDISEQAPMVNAEAYSRDLQYDQQNLSMEERTQRELNLLTEKVKSAVVDSYQQKIDANQDPESAYADIRESIENDLMLADENYRAELQKIALAALDAARDGGVMSEFQNSALESVVAKNLEERGAYLNAETTANASSDNNGVGATSNNPFPSSSRAKDAEKLSYNNKQEVITSLASTGDNTKWVSTASANQDLGRSVIRDGSVSIQLKFKFLGTGIEGGPTISFNRTIGANALLMYEGMDSPVDSSGHFSIWKRDFNGNILMKNGVKQRRFMAFYCSVWTTYSSTYKGEGTVSFNAGVGSMTEATSLSSYESTSNSITSRRIYIPDSIGNQIVTVNTIRQLCWKDFFGAQIRRGLTVKQSLYNMTKNTISNMAFSHPKSKCASDTQCLGWARKMNLSASVKSGLYPRCVEDAKEKFRYCALKGLENSECSVYEKGVLTSKANLNGCDYGLRCTIASPALYFPGTTWIVRASAGVCKPVNKSTYRRPVLK